MVCRARVFDVPGTTGFPWWAAALVAAGVARIFAADRGGLAPSILCYALAVLVFFGYALSVRSERLVVVPGVGVQLETRYGCGLTTSAFLDGDAVDDAVIVEGVSLFSVRFYLAFLVRGASEMAVAFPNLLPRLHVLQPTLRETRAALFPPPS
eukprot:tig00020554_g10873.t1